MRRLLAFGAAALVFAAPPAKAQHSGRSGPIELGIDGGIFFGLDAPHVTAVTLPVQDFRVGFFVTDRAEIEPRFTLLSTSGGGPSATAYDFELGLVYQPDGDRVGKGLYGRPFVGVSGVRVARGGSDNTGYLGFGVGLKIPFADRRLATRLEANYAHGFSTPSSNQIGILFGLSFFTR